MVLRPQSARWILARWVGCGLLVAMLLSLAPWLPWIRPVAAASPAAAERTYRCGEDPLLVSFQAGPVDAVGIPNTLAGTLPGASVLLRWQGQALPLPRTNNAGAPTYSDGKWLWREEDPDHARLLLRRPGGDLQEFRCEALP